MKSSNAVLPPYYGVLLQAVTQIASPSRDPLIFFQFFGPRSRLSAKIDKWASTTGYTFFTWLRIETYRHVTSVGQVTYRPRLFSAVDQDANSIEFFFSKGTFFAAASIDGSTQVVEFSGFKFENEKWYFVAVSHSSHKKKSSSSEVSIFVNGAEYRSSNKLDFPLTHTAVTLNIGASVAKVEKTMEKTSFWGLPVPFRGRGGLPKVTGAL